MEPIEKSRLKGDFRLYSAHGDGIKVQAGEDKG
jgi:hypothetical protein